MGMVTATIIMHNGINTGGVFGHILIFPIWNIPKSIVSIRCMYHSYNRIFYDRRILHGKIQDASIHFNNGEHADHLRSCYYATKGVSFGAIDPAIPNTFIPKIGKFPMIILWAVAAVVVWFIWNKTHLERTFMQSVETRRQQPYPVFPYSK